MTVLDEINNTKRYDYINFVEFLDMLCRVAIIGITEVDTLDYKTYKLLGIIYNRMYNKYQGAFTKEDYPLYNVDENIR